MVTTKIDGRRRPHRAAPVKALRIVVRCSKEPFKHGKMLQFKPEATRELAETVAKILDGSSEMYIYPPGELSPIGRCGVCGAAVEAEVEEVQHAELKS